MQGLRQESRNTIFREACDVLVIFPCTNTFSPNQCQGFNTSVFYDISNILPSCCLHYWLNRWPSGEGCVCKLGEYGFDTRSRLKDRLLPWIEEDSFFPGSKKMVLPWIEEGRLLPWIEEDSFFPGSKKTTPSLDRRTSIHGLVFFLFCLFLLFLASFFINIKTKNHKKLGLVCFFN